MPQRSVDRIASALANAGCRHAFGIPGGEVVALLDALAAHGIAVTLPRHENAGGFMAEGTWHATGAPAILFATIGPGFANAVNVIANAQQDRVPLIFLTGCVDRAEAETYTHQIMDHQAVIRPLVKASYRMTAGCVDLIMQKALGEALSGQPGPVHIDIPISLADAEEAEDPHPVLPASTTRAPAGGDLLSAAQQAFAQARKPLMLAGLDAVVPDMSAEIRHCCEAHDIPLITTYKAKGLLPEDHPLALGAAGLSPIADAALKPWLQEADLILLVGYDPIEMRVGWRNPWPTGITVIDITQAPFDHGMHRATYRFDCDISEGLAAVSQGERAEKTDWDLGKISTLRADLRETHGCGDAWGPAVVVDMIRDAAPDDAVATVDSGAHRILLSQVWKCSLPHTLLQSTGFCTMGCALPLAIGYAIAAPDRPVYAFMGDAGIEMVLGELATLRDTERHVVVVVFVDRSLALIELKQRSKQLPRVGVDIGGTDFVAVAEAMGGHGYHATDKASLADALSQADNASGFVLIACEIGDRPYDGRF